MPSTRTSLLCLVFLAGCKSAPAPERVHIQWRSVIASYGRGVTAPGNLPAAAAASVVSVKARIQAEPAREFSTPQTSTRRQEVELALKKVIQEAQNRLEWRLRETYLNEVDALTPDVEKQIAKDLESGTQAWLEEMIAHFDTYADQRGPIFARHVLLSEFPPRSDRRMRALGVFEDRDKRAAEVKARLDALDAAYQREKQARLAKVNEANRAKAQALWEGLEAKRLEALQRASKEAEGRAVVDLENVSSILEHQPPMVLPSTRAVGASESLRSDPKVPSTPRPPEIDHAQLAHHDVEIWLSQSGYTLSDGGGRDATQEFLAWKAKYIGP